MKSMQELSTALRLVRDGRLTEALTHVRNIAGEAMPATAPAGHRALRDRLADLAGAWSQRAAGLAEPLRAPAPAPAQAPPPPAPSPGGSFTAHTYVGRHGQLGYKLYVPSGYDGTPCPLVVMLHGCTQSPDDFAAGTGMNRLAEDQGFLVAYPAQTQLANASKCWNWFRPSDQKRDAGEPALIAGLTREIMAHHAVAPGRIYIAGLSAGGAAAAVMAANYPDLFAAAGVHSGLACGAARDMASAFDAMRQGMREGGPAPQPQTPQGPPVRTIVFHGDKDSTVNPVNGEQVLAQFRAGAGELKPDVAAGRAAGGLDYTRTRLSDRDGRPLFEKWIVHGAGHAWSGGTSAGTYTEPRGPDASREMLRFFLAG
ncbi:MAG TPA: PHB depolymerase family esterase [Xanthobacteraceae bacterium]|nr:PHB depolymerase family esterase [Xanthobacteraceae bacterium]